MHKALLALAALLILPCVARAQGGLYDNPVLGANGRPIVGAQYQVCTALGVQGSLCTPSITVYSNSTLTSAITALNQVTDSQGNLTFWLTPGTYYLTLYGAGIRTQTRAIAVACLPGTGCVLTGTASALTSATANPASAGVIRLAVGDTACWRNNANGANLCFSINGADALLFNGAGIVQTGVANTFTANQSFPTIISTTANPSSGGWARLANSDQHCWRNSTNSGNNCLAMNTDRLAYGGANVVTNSSTDTLTNKTITSATVNGGFANNAGTGLKHVRYASCTTGLAQFDECTDALSWIAAGPAFADTNYTAVCTADNLLGGAGRIWVRFAGNKTVNTMDVVITALDATGAGSHGTVDCIAIHD